ncbi:hypothetical protein MCOR28_011798, partial [Pyricularia oryzae]
SPDRKAEYGDPLESDLVLMPIHKCSHWYLLVMYKLSGTGYTIQEDRVVCFLDSLESPSRSYEDTFTLWMQYLKDMGYRGEVHQRNVKIPQQSNNADCGVFHLAFAYQIVEDRQKFIDAVENRAGLDWTVDAPKWRELVRLELTSANDKSAVVNTAAEKIINVESDDDTCVEVVSVCHALTSSMDRDPATGHDVTAHARRDDFDVAKIACPTAHDSYMTQTLSPSSRQDLLSSCIPRPDIVLSEPKHSNSKGSSQLPPLADEQLGQLAGNQQHLPGLSQQNILDPTHGETSERSNVEMNYTRTDTKDGNNTISQGFGIDAHNPDNIITTVLSTGLA